MAEHFDNPLAIRKVIHRLRGGSQAQMVQCDDGKFYAAKFAGNPQTDRTLINEWFVSRLMSHLGICTPVARILYLPPSIQQSGKLFFSMGSKRVPVAGDLHFGSLYPVDPETTCILDFLPNHLLPGLVNLADFATTWVLDRWTYQTDKRQAVYVRAKNAQPGGFRAYMIDNGMCFSGQHWEMRDAQCNCKDWNRRIYQHLDMHAHCERTLAQIGRLTPDTISKAAHGFPPSWLKRGDRERLEVLVQSLLTRQRKLDAIMERHLDTLAMPCSL